MSDKQRVWERGDVVVLLSTSNDLFYGSVAVVNEPKTWGAQVGVMIPGAGVAYYRAVHDEMLFIGELPENLDNRAEAAIYGPLS